MVSEKVLFTFLGLIASGLMACNAQSDYEKYSSCVLDAMKGQDRTMRHLAEESCELKNPYERDIYWKNEIDLDFSFDPIRETVSFKVNQNKTDFSVTKIEVIGSHLTCTNIPERPKKPNFQSAFNYEERAKTELGLTAQKLTFDGVDKYVEEQKLINERAEAIKSAEDQKKKLGYQNDLNDYDYAQSSWSFPVEVKLQGGSGEIDLHKFEQVSPSSTMDLVRWQRGPQCMRFIKVYGLRDR